MAERHSQGHGRNVGPSQFEVSILPPSDVGCVYRFFNKESEADALAAGNVWISTLQACRRYENAERGDRAEGTTVYATGRIAGDTSDPELALVAKRMGVEIGSNARNVALIDNIVTTHVDDALVLCTTELFDPSSLSQAFGDHCVRISNPVEFFKIVSLSLRRYVVLRGALMGRVVYGPRHHRGLEPYPPGPLGFVKPPVYAAQHEVRMLWDVHPAQRPLKPGLLDCPESAEFCERIA